MVSARIIEKNNCNYNLWDHICTQTCICIEQFGLFSSKNIVVGLSGGKDSSLLTFVLRELGYNVHPVVVDMGYIGFESKSIQAVFKSKGIMVEIIDAKQSCKELPDNSRVYLTKLIKSLHEDELETPCTYCSMVKRTLLSNYASSLGMAEVAYGHHRDDIISTMLKDYYIFLYYKEHGKYNADTFRDFVNSVDPNIRSIEKLINEQLVGTMSISVADRITNTKIVRPFANVSEVSIKKCVSSIGFSPLSSGCSHEVFQNGNLQPITKREIVHSKTLTLCEDEKLSDSLILTAMKCLDASGTSLYNPRAIRQKLYPGFEDEL